MRARLLPLSYYYKRKIPLHERGRGAFHISDAVRWGKREGRVVEVVPYGMYPDYHARLKVRGYYREHESYVVEDVKGRRYWPRVGNLIKVEKHK